MIDFFAPELNFLCSYQWVWKASQKILSAVLYTSKCTHSNIFWKLCTSIAAWRDDDKPMHNKSSEVGIYKRKQESKKTGKHAFDQESDQERKKERKKLFFSLLFSKSLSCFLYFFLHSCFLLWIPTLEYPTYSEN